MRTRTEKGLVTGLKPLGKPRTKAAKKQEATGRKKMISPKRKVASEKKGEEG